MNNDKYFAGYKLINSSDNLRFHALDPASITKDQARQEWGTAVCGQKYIAKAGPSFDGCLGFEKCQRCVKIVEAEVAIAEHAAAEASADAQPMITLINTVGAAVVRARARVADAVVEAQTQDRWTQKYYNGVAAGRSAELQKLEELFETVKHLSAVNAAEANRLGRYSIPSTFKAHQ